MADTQSTLADCTIGRRYRVAHIDGGEALVRRLHSLGLALDKTIVKTGGQLFHGPVMVRIQHTELAIGHRTAARIRVEPITHAAPDPLRQS